MKKMSFIVLLITLIGLGACIPGQPQEVLDYCKAEYEEILADDPDFPPSFIGACVATIQNEDPKHLIPLCGYEPFWELLNIEALTPITNRKECQDFLRNYTAP